MRYPKYHYCRKREIPEPDHTFTYPFMCLSLINIKPIINPIEVPTPCPPMEHLQPWILTHIPLESNPHLHIGIPTPLALAVTADTKTPLVTPQTLHPEAYFAYPKAYAQEATKSLARQYKTAAPIPVYLKPIYIPNKNSN